MCTHTHTLLALSTLESAAAPPRTMPGMVARIRQASATCPLRTRLVDLGILSSDASHTHGVHCYGFYGTIVARLDVRDLDHHVEAGLVDGFAEDGVLGFAGREPIEEVIVDDIHEELRAARVWLARVRHREGSRLVADLGRILVIDVPAALARFLPAGFEILVR